MSHFMCPSSPVHFTFHSVGSWFTFFSNIKAGWMKYLWTGVDSYMKYNNLHVGKHRIMLRRHQYHCILVHSTLPYPALPSLVTSLCWVPFWRRCHGKHGAHMHRKAYACTCTCLHAVQQYMYTYIAHLCVYNAVVTAMKNDNQEWCAAHVCMYMYYMYALHPAFLVTDVSELWAPSVTEVPGWGRVECTHAKCNTLVNCFDMQTKCLLTSWKSW